MASQSPDEDSLSSDASPLPTYTEPSRFCLNPLTRIHCLPTCNAAYAYACAHCASQSPDEDSLSSDLQLNACEDWIKKWLVSIP